MDISGASVHWYAKPGWFTYSSDGATENERACFLIFMLLFIKLFLFLSEIRKQRKMGHITIVGPSKYSVKARLDKLLQRDAYDPKKG